MAKTQVVFCPKCKRPVEAADYFSSGGISDWRIESAGIGIVCPRCGYRGLPLSMDIEGIEKKSRKGSGKSKKRKEKSE